MVRLHQAVTQMPELTQDSQNLQAFEQVFEKYWGAIHGMLRRMLGDPAEAEDLALEAFYRLHQRFPIADPDFNTGGWLYRVATNLGLHAIRSRQRRQHYEAQAGKRMLQEAPDDQPAEMYASQEDQQLARRALADMNPRRSQLLVMRYSGMAYKEIAEAMDLSPTSLGPLLLRAEREFEKRYRELAQEEP